ncbi:hypothetical protein BZA05DRAFT_333985 [Tricharina praecox]|uniref:uncharacterized protein n=1 Tax=Tricharina praecox TaxID=43433 RepID=UPI00221F0DCF|nr:uncharacterized protein BZA05DRAFT_333985 [Tricharina praecox]KAI5855456.1 hypothetical protein BZA05DRAFT_333985 [Tricharina praecox]
MSNPKPTGNSDSLGGVQIPPNAFDFIPDMAALINRVFSDELDPKDIIRESNHILLNLNKARELIANLPSVEKTLEEQYEAEKALEERIALQRKMLKEVAEMAEVKDVLQGSVEMEVDR